MQYKLCILAAGRGTRSTKYENLHKALLPVSNRPAISWVLDSVDEDVPIVVAVGHNADQIIAYLNYVYKDRQIDYAFVDNYDKPGSGPGYSLMQCMPFLQCSFIVTAVDTLIREKHECPVENWIGVKRVTECKPYCLFSSERGFHYDETATDALAFIGMGGVVDYLQFWDNLSNKKTIKNEHQMTNGFENLPSLSFKEFTWYDVGNDSAYNQTQEAFDEPIVAEKEGEILYIEKRKVVKFFSDTDKVRRRLERIQSKACAPETVSLHENIYGYNYVDGDILSEACSDYVDIFFDFCEDFFKPSGDKTISFLEDCREMYEKKTYSRIASLANSDLDKILSIDGTELKPIYDLLSLVDWNLILKKSIPYSFHGDFQAANIVISDKVTLIDWRDSFGCSTVYGDMYYDLGKLYHSIAIIGMDKKSFSPTYSGLLLDKFMSFCQSKGFDWRHVELLGCLQYVTIASLYKAYDWKRFYFLLGKIKLTQWLEKKD